MATCDVAACAVCITRLFNPRLLINTSILSHQTTIALLRGPMYSLRGGVLFAFVSGFARCCVVKVRSKSRSRSVVKVRSKSRSRRVVLLAVACAMSGLLVRHSKLLPLM